MEPAPNVELRGWLMKLGAKGLFKSYKRRWCVFRSSFGKLFYGETPAADPLGFVDVDVGAQARTEERLSTHC